MNALLRLCSLLLALGLMTTPASAQATLTWNGSASTAWATAANWTPNAVPGASDTVLIPGGTPNAPSITANTTIANLSVQNGATLRVHGNSTIGHVMLTVANGFTNHGEIELGNSAHVWRGDLTVTNGTLVNEGTIVSRSTTPTNDHINVLAAQLDNRGTLRIERVLSLNKAGAQHVNTGTIEVVGGNFVITQSGEGASFNHSGTIDLSADGTLTVSSGIFNHTAGSITGAGSTVHFTGGTANLTPALETAQLNLNVTNATLNGPGKITIAVGRTATLHGATINADLENRGTLRVTNSSTIASTTFTNSSAASLRILGNSTIGHVMLTVSNGFTNHGEIELGNSAHVWRGDLTVTNGTLVNEGTIVSRSTTPTNDHINVLAAQLDNRGTLRIERVLSLNKTNAIHRNSGAIDLTGGNFTVAQSGELAAFLQTGMVTVGAGRVLTFSGSTVYLQAGTITGTMPAPAEIPAAFHLANTTLNLATGLGLVDLDLSINGTVVHGPGKITGTPGYTITLHGATVNADFDNHGAIRVAGNSTIASTTFTNSSAASLRILGNSTIGHVMLTVSNGFTNHGEIELGNSAHVWRGDLTVTNGTLVNEGTIVSRSTTPTNDHINVLAAQLDNRGTLRIERVLNLTRAGASHRNSGSIDVWGGNLTFTLSAENAEFENAGSFTVHSGRTATFTGGSITNAAAGIFHGGGTVSIANTSFNNSGTFAPGLRPMFGRNLIVNGDAELGPVGTSAANVSITGWSDPGPMTILPYDFEDNSQPYLASTDPGPADRGSRFFWGGIGASSAITQTINVADIASLVDLGVVTYDLSGWLGGFTVQNDQMRLTASFRDGENEELALSTLGPVEVADRNFETALLLRQTEGAVPAGTRSILLTLTATRFAGTANNGFADNLSLVLNQQGGAEQGRTTGILSVSGDLPMAPNDARIEVAIGGLTAGAEYDRVSVTGAATLAGRMDVAVINNFVPTEGDEFVVMTFGSRHGEFPQVTVTGLPEGVFLNPEYSATSVVLRASGQAAGPPPPALASPANGATDVTVTPTLQWQAASGAVSYHVQLATDAPFSTIVFEDDEFEATSTQPGQLDHLAVHYWRVRASDGEAWSPWSQVFSFTTAAGVSDEDGPGAPIVFTLEPNYPNPFSLHTTIRFGLAQDCEVRLEVFDLLGRQVAVLADAPMGRGFHDVHWDSDTLPSGSYVYRLTAGDFVAVRKMLIVRR
jgi:hypothetical protein